MRTVKRPELITNAAAPFAASSARWGYFDRFDVTVQGALIGCSRADSDDPGAEMPFCAKWGATPSSF